MTAATDVLAVLNRRTAITAARAEAERTGLDSEQLLDSASLHAGLSALDPDAPAFSRRVRELVQQTAMARGLTPAPTAQPPGAPPAQAGPDRQWTVADVERSTPAECVAAGEAGMLRDLGYNPRRKRR